MANRFWVGGAGTWDSSTTTHWSTSSGGGGGASAPGGSDDVFLDGSSGAGTVTLSFAAAIKSLTCTGFTGTLTGTSQSIQTGTGVCTLAAGMTLSGSITFIAGSGTPAVGNLTTAGKTLFAINCCNVGSFQLQDDLTVGLLTIQSGTQAQFDANGKNVTITGSLATNVNNATALKMGSGTWTFSGAGTVCDLTGVHGVGVLTITGAPTIKLTDATSASKTFKGANYTYGTVWCSGAGTGTFILQNLTATIFKDDDFSAHTTQLDLGTGIATTSSTALNNSGVSLELVSGSFSSAAQATTTMAAFKADVGAVGLTMGGTWTLSGTGIVWDLSAAAAMTLTPATLIKITDATAASKTFSGGSKTYAAIQLTGAGTGAFIIKGSNTFTTFTLDTPPHTVQFQDGTTNLATTWSFSGTSAAGNNILESILGGTWDIVCVAGIAASYVTLQGSHAHGGTFTASNSYDAGDNLFWVFVRSASTSVYFDSSYQYNGVSTATLSGLNWLWGETVGVVADGVDIGDATVSTAGKLTLPGGVSASVITIGKRYLSYGKTLRAPQAGNQDGSSLGRKMGIKSVAADMLNSSGLYVGTLTGVQPVPPAWRQTNNGDLYTGMFDCPIDDSYSNNGVVVFQTDRGYPCTVRAIQFGVEAEP